jgi:hypothetical protein
MPTGPTERDKRKREIASRVHREAEFHFDAVLELARTLLPQEAHKAPFKMLIRLIWKDYGPRKGVVWTKVIPKVYKRMTEGNPWMFNVEVVATGERISEPGMLLLARAIVAARQRQWYLEG